MRSFPANPIMLQSAFLFALCLGPSALIVSPGGLRFPDSSDTLPGLLKAKSLDTALVNCCTPGAINCGAKERHPAVHEEIVGDVVRTSHRQCDPVWTDPRTTTNETTVKEQYIIRHCICGPRLK